MKRRKWSARRGRTIKVRKRLIGSSNRKYDTRHKALPPGKRRSRSGKTYYEYRRNRADIGKFL